MSQALCFNEITFSPVNRHNSPWIRAVELSKALGFKREDQAAKIYRAHADEFTSDTAQLVEISDNADSAFPVKSLLFSLRGCHLLAMFARTPVAKQFRRWVLDVIEQYGDQVPVPPVENPEQLSPSHRSELKGIVDAKLSTYPASVQGKARSEIWTRFNRHFRIAEYAQLPAERMAEARDYLIELEVKALKALPSATPSTPPVIEDRRIPDAMAELRKLVMHCGRVRNIIHIECHPGAMSFSMSAKEREVHYAFQGIYQTAVDNICAATHALDACLKLRAIYPARG